MVLLIDNYDSFVFNLARYIGELGHARTVVRNDALTIDDILKLNPSHIVLSPGPGAPVDAGICLDVIHHFYQKIPILGVCLGHQAIGHYFNGAVVRAREPMHGKSSDIVHDGCGVFQEIVTPLRVGRYHSLIVSPDGLSDVIKITAWSASGEIMALQHRQFPVFGVQFHPESILTHQGHALLRNFLRFNTSPSP